MTDVVDAGGSTESVSGLSGSSEWRLPLGASRLADMAMSVAVELSLVGAVPVERDSTIAIGRSVRCVHA